MLLISTANEFVSVDDALNGDDCDELEILQ